MHSSFISFLIPFQISFVILFPILFKISLSFWMILFLTVLLFGIFWNEFWIFAFCDDWSISVFLIHSDLWSSCLDLSQRMDSDLPFSGFSVLLLFWSFTSIICFLIFCLFSDHWFSDFCESVFFDLWLDWKSILNFSFWSQISISDHFWSFFCFFDLILEILYSVWSDFWSWTLAGFRFFFLDWLE